VGGVQYDCVVCTLERPLRVWEGMYTEERADEGTSMGWSDGRASSSSTAGEMLRVEEVVRNDEEADAESVRFRVLVFLVDGL
jgi:hypothetical protein